ncbi:MAG: hypothetical protein WAV70_12655, partial [Anaerolineae bacterium]
NIHAGFSDDGIHWRINPQPIAFRCHDTEIGALAYRYDPRVCWNVVFPCAALTDAATGRVAIYYGAADTVTGLAFGYLQEIVAFLKENSQV